MLKSLRIVLGLLSACLICNTSFAALKIEITEGVTGALPIAVIPFGWEGAAGVAPEDIGLIVTNDLSRSGKFAPMGRDKGLPQPVYDTQIRFDNWKSLGADHLVIGRMRAMGPDAYVVQFQLFDVFKQQQLIGYSFPATRATLRRVAHTISDLIYEKIIGVRGAFNTLMTYVTATRQPDGSQRYTLHLADSDGYNEKTILTSQEPIMSPSWSPDGKRLAYVSFEKKVAAIYVQDWLTSQREKISAVKGINGAPAWSPDGSKLALTLSHEGDPEIYVLDVPSRQLTRLTRSSAIDTEPAWMPDGRNIVFTSDRAGNPQLYVQALGSTRAQRLTFEGKYNASASVSSDGKSIAMVTGDGNQFRIAVLEVGTNNLRILTEGKLDESPSFAPNDSMILYAIQGGQRGILGAVSADGRMKQRISISDGDVREPVWSPFLK